MSASEALFHPVIVVYQANAKTLAEKPYRYQVQIIWQHDYKNECVIWRIGNVTKQSKTSH